MDWIAIGTLIAAIAAAIAAVWAALISQRQFKLAASELREPLPLVEATIDAVQTQPDWTAINLMMRNRGQVAIDLLSVTLIRPSAIGLLSDKDSHGEFDDEWGGRPLLEPLPAGLARRIVRQAAYMNRVGTGSQHSSGPVDTVTVYAHGPLSRFIEDPGPCLSLEMRWRDHTTKTFAMAVKIIKPNNA